MGNRSLKCVNVKRLRLVRREHVGRVLYLIPNKKRLPAAYYALGFSDRGSPPGSTDPDYMTPLPILGEQHDRGLSRSRLPATSGWVLSLLFMLTMLTTAASAQNGNTPGGEGSARAIVSAQVLELNVNLVTIRPVRFDRVQPSQGEIFIHPITNSNAGLMRAEGAPNAAIQISFQRQVQLVHESGSISLTMNYEIAGYDQDNQNSAEMITNNTRSFQLNKEGDFYIWVGGRVNIQNAISGNYEGDFTVEVEYI